MKIPYALNMQLKGKTILLTGGSSGIGYALAKAFAKKGCHVYSFDRDLPKDPIDGVTSTQVDIRNCKQIEDALEGVQKPIDILINNAGVMRRGTIFETTEEEFDLLFGVHLKGAWLMLKCAKPHLAENATIIQMSSRHGPALPINPGIYALTKNAAQDLVDIVARTYPEYSVKTLYPGPVDTPLTYHGSTEEDMERKKKIMRSPEFVAEKTIELLETDKDELIFDPETKEYLLR